MISGLLQTLTTASFTMCLGFFTPNPSFVSEPSTIRWTMLATNHYKQLIHKTWFLRHVYLLINLACFIIKRGFHWNSRACNDFRATATSNNCKFYHAAGFLYSQPQFCSSPPAGEPCLQQIMDHIDEETQLPPIWPVGSLLSFFINVAHSQHCNPETKFFKSTKSWNFKMGLGVSPSLF